MLLGRGFLRVTKSPRRAYSLTQPLQGYLLHSIKPSMMEVVVNSAPSQPSNIAEPEVYCNRWELLWGAGLARGERWDAAAPSPALMDLLQSGKVDVKGTRVLVPGCGRGYDLPVFRSAGAVDVVGLELAPSAVREAWAYLREVEAKAEVKAEAGPLGDEVQGMRVEEGDFFQWKDPRISGNGSFDVGFDYTFGCAMHPSAREQWAQSWARQIRSGGLLVTLVFPVNPDADLNVGPPFPVSPELYEQLLVTHGFELTYQAAVSGELSHPSRVGKEVMMVWRKM